TAEPCPLRRSVPWPAGSPAPATWLPTGSTRTRAPPPSTRPATDATRPSSAARRARRPLPSPRSTSATRISRSPARPASRSAISPNGFAVGQGLVVGVGATQETATVVDVGTAGANGTGVTVAQPLKMDHLILMLVRGTGTGITLSAPLTGDHASGSTTRGQGT